MPSLALSLARTVLLRASAAVPIPIPMAGLVLWLDADSLAGVSDGDALSSWTDRSEANHHAIQATSTKQPLYTAGIQNGKPGVLFDGTSDGMQTPAIDLTGTDKITTFSVFTPSVTDTNMVVYESSPVLDSNVGAVNLIRITTNAARAGFKTNQANRVVATPTTVTTTPALVTVRVDLALDLDEGIIWLNGETTPGAGARTGSTFLSTDPGLGNFAFNIGARNNGASLWFSGYIFEQIVYARALADAERIAVRDYLNAKWAVY